MKIKVAVFRDDSGVASIEGLDFFMDGRLPNDRLSKKYAFEDIARASTIPMKAILLNRV